MIIRIPRQPSQLITVAVDPLAALRVLSGLAEDCGSASIRGAYIFNHYAR